MVEDQEKRIKELEEEIGLYRELPAAVYVLYEASQALDEMGGREDEPALQAWDSYWDATEDLFDFVREDEPRTVMSA